MDGKLELRWSEQKSPHSHRFYVLDFQYPGLRLKSITANMVI
jgi:hypothetical protein